MTESTMERAHPSESIQPTNTLDHSDQVEQLPNNPHPLTRFVSWLGNLVFSTLAVGCLVALGWWGHHTGWKIPTFAEITGTHETVEADWCTEHGVPESECVLCSPDLVELPKSHGWCSVHGVHNCPLEHPDIVQLKYMPKIGEAELERADNALKFTKRPENNSRCKLHPTVVQVAARSAKDHLELQFEPVWTAPIEETINANGEITYDKTNYASLATVVPGRVWRVEKQIGDRVKKGDILALIDAVHVGKAKADFLQALAEVDLRRKNVNRLKPISGTAIAEARVLEEEAELTMAEAGLVSAEQALKNLGIAVEAEVFLGMTPKQQNQKMQFLGLPKSVAVTLDSNTTTGNLIAVRASLDGFVVDRSVVEGEMVDSSDALFVLADTRTLWLKLYVRNEDAKYLKLGQSVRFLPNGADRGVIGTLNWISTAADEKTRTVRVRADLDNAKGLLRANTFGTGTILLRQDPNAIVVPNDAVHWDGNCHVVFVQDKDYHVKGHPKYFHVRNIRPGAKTSRQTEVIAGVWPGEVVVTAGSGALRSQLLKSNLGAG